MTFSAHSLAEKTLLRCVMRIPGLLSLILLALGCVPAAAQQSGIEDGDVITGIDGQKVGSVSELQELVARHRPGHTVSVTYRRQGKEQSVKTTLKNYEGRESISRPEVLQTIEGAHLENLSYSDLSRRNLDGGVLISSLDAGKWKKAGVHESFIITHIDKVEVDNIEDLNRILAYKSGGMLVEGVYKNGEKGVYGVQW